MMIKNRRAQGFIMLILILLGLMMFIFAVPMISQIIGVGVGQTGTATGFIMKLFPWLTLIFILAIGLRAITTGEFF